MASEEPEHLLVFPVPIKGECWYSLLARYHAISGNHSELYTFRQLFGSRTALNAAVTLPSRVQLIDTWFPEGFGLTSDRIIRELTAYQYLKLTSLFPDSAYQSLMQSREKRGRSMRWQMVNVLQGHHQGLRFCPDCVRSDTEEYHHSCWHLVHQIDGVRYCPIHGTRLLEGPQPVSGRLTHFYLAPDTETAEQMEKTGSGESSDAFRQQYIELAKTIDWLLVNGGRIETEEKLLQLYETELGSDPSWTDVLHLLVSGDGRFLEDLYSRKELLDLLRGIIDHGLRRQPPLLHALLIMRLGGAQWLSKELRT